MWRLDAEQATFAVGPLSGKVDLSRPHRGIHDLEIAGKPWPTSRLLQVELPAASHNQMEIAETYLRQGDLVATYAPLPPFTVQPQIYWRLRSSDAHGAVGVELIVSVQTSLLFSEPQTTVSCQFAADPDGQRNILAGGDQQAGDPPGILAVQTPDGEHVIIQWVHPSDFHSLEREPADGGAQRFQVRLFQEHLEKGVIRRARVWAWLLPSQEWRPRAHKLLAMLSSEPPPLTA